jgi:L-glutamine-phosphate cytidylyltransferase
MQGIKMQVVILAAGLGKRLDNPSSAPKALTLLANGRSILAFQLEQLSQYIRLDLVTLVVGYHFEEIIKLFPDLNYIYNEDFAAENTAGSLKRALKKVSGDLLWLNGDVVFHPSLIKTLLNFRKSSMIVNVGHVGEEEVKYRTDSQKRILEVSKEVKKPEGEAIGINYFSEEDLPHLKVQLERCLVTDYFEKAIEGVIKEGVPVTALPIESSLACEIDFPEDLLKANEMILRWNLAG